MTTFEAIYLMLTFDMFIIALLAYINRNNKRKYKITVPSL